MPLFGKPRADNYARWAAVIIESLNSSTAVRLSNGVSAPVKALAAEIVTDRAQGYMFHQCHADLRAHVGPAMASVRIFTLLTDHGVEPWYAVIRVPAKTATHDGDAFSRRSGA